ncbi:PIN domain-like protein [Guyanagaster necrorhizus]|uniref:PIN domain-like protein n=1 Tax=Guyanagaster necrorhizus TaxID=856835 RepID=A0A9P7VM84_9AGAR|nr:PIN domain-like protein [Guyanagaster necrorhizus MCA 3950]KAG7443108.1 PIN domain-like protein [Guyanagaster necrorhizus MCA 3950]
MGVAKLWPLLDESSSRKSLYELTMDSTNRPPHAFRLGVDVSLWFFHAEYGQEGENPELRTLFFRLEILLRNPILPLFMFDGPGRPAWKRGRRINTWSENALTDGLKAFIEAFGFEWRYAPGEAEAELAYLNAAGIIDGVLSDDVDALLFGAKTVWRNPSSAHAQTSATEKRNFVLVFQDVKLSRAELILIALCAGGDYSPEGLPGCGPNTAEGLARAGHADTLYRIATTLTRAELPVHLCTWRAEIIKELRTNSSGCLGHKHGKLANSVPETFPDINILLAYTEPVTSPLEKYNDIDWMKKEPNIPAIAALCEMYFEWGYKESIVKRFRTLIWPGLAVRVLRRYIIEGEQGKDEKLVWRKFAGDEVVDAGELGWMTKIHRTRQHQSAGRALQYRVEVDVSVPVHLAEAGVHGLRRPAGTGLYAADPWQFETEDRAIDPAQDPRRPLLIWLPGVMVERARSALVEEYEDMVRRRKGKKKSKGKKKVTEEMSGNDEPPPSPRKKKTTALSTTPHTPMKRKANPAFLSTPSSSSKILLALDKVPKTKTLSSPTKTPSRKPAPFPMDLEHEFGSLSPRKDRDLYWVARHLLNYRRIVR